MAMVTRSSHTFVHVPPMSSSMFPAALQDAGLGSEFEVLHSSYVLMKLRESLPVEYIHT